MHKPKHHNLSPEPREKEPDTAHMRAEAEMMEETRLEHKQEASDKFQRDTERELSKLPKTDEALRLLGAAASVKPQPVS